MFSFKNQRSTPVGKKSYIRVDIAVRLWYYMTMTTFQVGDLVRKKHMENDKHTLAVVVMHNAAMESFNRLKVNFVTDGWTQIVKLQDYEVVSKNEK